MDPEKQIIIENLEYFYSIGLVSDIEVRQIKSENNDIRREER